MEIFLISLVCGKLFEPKQVESAVSFKAVVRSAIVGGERDMGNLITRLRMHLAPWDKVLHVLCPT